MKTAFLDRDGTIILEPPDTKLPTRSTYQLLPHALEGMKSLQNAGFDLVIVSNQGSGSPQSYREASFVETQMMLEADCAKAGIRFKAVFMCPHTDEDQCACRKPSAGMVKDYLATFPVDLAHSVMIGDRNTDAAFAKNIGVRFLRAESNVRFPDPAQIL